MKIGAKINLSYIILFVIITIAVGFFIISNIAKSMESQANKKILEVNDAKVDHIISFLEDQKEMSNILAAASIYRDFLKSPKDPVIIDKINKRLVRTLELDKNLLELYIFDKNGVVTASSDQGEVGEDRSTQAAFTEAKKDAYIGEPYFYNPYNKIVYSVSSPVIDDNGDFLGTSVLIFSGAKLNVVLSNTDGSNNTQESFLINNDRYFLTDSLFLGSSVILSKQLSTKNALDCFAPEAVALAKNNWSSYIAGNIPENYIDYRGMSIVGAHTFLPVTGWCLMTKIDRAEILSPVFAMNVVYLIASMLSIFLFFIIGFILSKNIMRSLSLLGKGIKAVDSGDLNFKINIKSGDEIEEISKSFSRMVESVKESRFSIDQKVKDQTKEIIEKQQFMEDQQRATLNILEDVEEEKIKTNALLAGIGEGVIATDSAMNVIFMNRAAEEALGWGFVGVVGKNLYDFLKMFDGKGRTIPEEVRPFTIALATGKEIIGAMSKNYFYERRNGEKFPVSISITPITVEGKLIGAINVFRDITHEKDVDRAKTEFVSLASHQLRTPLSAINWYTEMLLAGDAGKITDEQKQYLEEVYRSNKRMVDLVNSLLNVSRIDLGTFAIVPEPTDISDVSKSILMELTPMIKNKKMNIEENYDSKIPKINVDAKLIRVIFQNLLSNAVKYTPEGGKVIVSIAKDSKNVLIKIQDTGYGIPIKDQPRMFEKLFRADNVREKETDGTGLGMYIVKSILEQAGGKITFESEENKGTTFFVTIPLSGMKAKEGVKDLS
jgi:two-component system phosphate regulon sensor histidine kinase PhoR/two-component system sensor histidine kinase VicK